MDLVNVSQKIKALRLKQNLTVARLAEKSGLSKGFISRLENFRINASIRALNRVAAALGVPLSELFHSEGKPPEYVFGHIDKGEPIERNNGAVHGLKYYALAYCKTDRLLNPFFIEYTPSDNAREFLMHDSDEFFMVLEGELDFLIGNESQPTRMCKGDTVYLGRNLPHSARLAPGCAYASALTIYS